MSGTARRITLDEWDRRYADLRTAGLREPSYGGPLRRHVEDGDRRLLKLRMDNSPAALRLWNFLLTEEDRLTAAVASGKKLVGTMKDLGTVPVVAYAFPELVAFYTDGAWWIPCVMHESTHVLDIADRLGIDDSFCPVRAMLGAFAGETHFPIPGLLTCSVGATCDDLSAIAQRVEAMGHPVVWWEVPHRREPDEGEPSVRLPGGFVAPRSQVDLVAAELDRVCGELAVYAGHALRDDDLAAAVARANRVRGLLDALRRTVFLAAACPMPALEMMIAEMLAIHFCSDQQETIAVLEELLAETQRRVAAGEHVLPADAVRVFWVNPVADLRAMNLLEDVGGRICGTDYMLCHALEPIPEELPPMEALAQMVLADPMVGPVTDRAARIVDEARQFEAEALVVSRVPGASHCALEGVIIGRIVHQQLGIPVVEVEVPPVSDSMEPTLRTRLEALFETATQARKKSRP